MSFPYDDWPVGYFESRSKNRCRPIRFSDATVAPIPTEAPTFWILWNPTNYKPPRVRFTSRAEAERIAAECSLKWNARIYVMEAKSVTEPASAPVRRTNLG